MEHFYRNVVKYLSEKTKNERIFQEEKEESRKKGRQRNIAFLLSTFEM